MDDQDSPLTALLIRWTGGDEKALEELTPLVYDRLRRIAANHVARERDGFSLCPTEVVHEAYQRLAAASHFTFADRAHFLAVASRQMRQVLVDHARAAGRHKRGGNEWQRVTMSDLGEAGEPAQLDILAIQEALDRLTTFDVRKAQIVDLMVFGGLKGTEIAELLQVPEHVVWREWRLARAWLQHELRAFGTNGS